MRTVPLSEAKARLSEIADEVDRTHERVHVTRNGWEYVVLVSAEDLESMEATIELLSDPGAVEAVRVALEEVASGEIVSLSEVDELMAERRTRDS